MARLMLVRSRKFLLGVGFGMLLVALGIVLTVPATGWTSAAPGGPSTVYACVNVFNGDTRLLFPGQPPNCAANELPVALSTDAPGANVTIVERTHDHELSGSAGGSAQMVCQAGERAAGGGVGVKNAEGNGIISHSLDIHASEPIGNPAVGWRGVYDWTSALDGYIVEVSVLCLS